MSWAPEEGWGLDSNMECTTLYLYVVVLHTSGQSVDGVSGTVRYARHFTDPPVSGCVMRRRATCSTWRCSFC